MSTRGSNKRLVDVQSTRSGELVRDALQRLRSWKSALTAVLLAGTMALSPASAIIMLNGNMEDLNALENIKLEVVVETNNAPFAFLQHAMNRPVGFDVDVVYELQRRLGFELKENRFFPVDTETGFSMLKNYSADLLIGGVVLNDSTRNDVAHTRVIYSSGFSIMAPKNRINNISPSNLKGARIGVKPNSPANYYVKKVLEGDPVEFTNSIRGFYQLTLGSIDAFVAERSSLLFFANSMPAFDLMVTDDVFDIQNGQFVFYMQKDSPYLDVFNRAISAMESDGTMYRLREKWLTR